MIVLHARQQLEDLARLLSIGARGHGRDKYGLQVASASDGRWHAEIKHVSPSAASSKRLQKAAPKRTAEIISGHATAPGAQLESDMG
jgi:hypothetical protein